MPQHPNACPYCGSYSLSKNICQDCGINISERRSNEKFSSLNSKNNKSFSVNLNEYTGPGTFEIRGGDFYDKYGTKISTRKFKFLSPLKANTKLSTSVGYLDFNKNSPNKISLFSAENLKLGELIMKEKDQYILNSNSGKYTLSKINSLPIQILAINGDPLLTIEENEMGKKKKLGIVIPSFLVHSTGKLPIDLVILLSYFIYYYSFFVYKVKPLSGYHYTIKKRIGIKIYDKNGKIVAKTAGENNYIWIIGILTFIFIIGYIIILYAIYKSNRSRTLVLVPSGEKIGFYEFKSGFKKAEFKLFQNDWNGEIYFSKHTRYLLTNSESGVISSPDGIYNIELMSIVENTQEKRMMTVYGWVNDFILEKNHDFDDYKSFILSCIIIDRFLTPKNVR